MAKETIGTIELEIPSQWDRKTIADGTWLQRNTMQPIYDNEVTLASAISDTSAAFDNIEQNIENIQDDLSDLSDSVSAAVSGLANKKDKQTPLEFSGSATKTVKKITQNPNGVMDVEFEEIDLPQEAPNVNITSTDSSITVNSSIDPDTNTKTFDLSVNSDAHYGVFTSPDGSHWTKSSGNIDSLAALSQGNYHYTVQVQYSVTSTSNVIAQIEFTGGVITQKHDIDMSYAHSGMVEFSGDLNASSGFYPDLTMPNGSSVNQTAYLFIHSTGANGSGGSSSRDNDKVAVAAGAVPNYLENVLVSDSDLVSLVKVGNQLRVNVNTQYSSDPKLSTMNESQIDASTGNYGNYQLQTGATKLIWNDTEFASYSYLNAMVYQMMRLSEAQGTITKANLALCGSLGFQSPPPCFNIGIFDAMTGALLGQSGLKFYGEDFSSDQELCTVDMIEESVGSLNIKRNFKYIVMVWTCGLQLAGLDKSTNYNYTYDFTLRQNLQGSISNKPAWPAITDLVERATVIPYVTFGASAI